VPAAVLEAAPARAQLDQHAACQWEVRARRAAWGAGVARSMRMGGAADPLSVAPCSDAVSAGYLRRGGELR